MLGTLFGRKGFGDLPLNESFKIRFCREKLDSGVYLIFAILGNNNVLSRLRESIPYRSRVYTCVSKVFQPS